MLTKEETQVFRKRLNQLARESGLTQKELAKTGVSGSVISRLLSGDSKKIKKESAEKLAEAVGTSLERILLASVAIEQPTTAGTVLRSDAIKLITDLGKAVIYGILLSPTGAVSNAAEAFKELARMEPPQLGWVMYSRGMCAAIGELVKELASRDIDDEQIQAIGNALPDCVDKQLAAANVVLDAKTLREPDGAFIAGMQNELIHTLNSVADNLSPTGGQEMANRLPAIFAASLNREFRTHQDKYARLITEIESPLDEAARRRLDLEDYGRRLHRELHEPLFDERFGLLSIFTPLRCEWKEPADDGHDEDEPGPEPMSRMEHQAGSKKWKRVAGDLFQCLDDWLDTLADNYDISDAIRVIEGDPGAGKSSATRVFAAFRAFRSPNVYDPHSVGELIGFHADVRTLLIPLHRFDYHDMLDTATDGFCKDNQLPTGWLEKPSTENTLTLVILDGLDELSKGGRIGAEAAADLMDTIVNWLSRHSDRRVAFLLCGRPVAVSEAVRGQRDLQQHATLRLLPFHVTTEEQQEFSNPDGVAADQRAEWWSRYRDAINEDAGEMPDWCNHSSLSELTAQPLFSYLLAVTYGLQGPDMTSDFSRNQLYRDIFDRAFQGEGRDGQSRANARFNDRRPEFEEVLETIALAAWHQAGRGATMGEVEALLDPRLQQAMQEVGKTVRSGLLCVLVGHYIHARRLAGGEEAFEFTHKTIGEYLTARGIVRRVLKIFRGWCARNKAHDQYTGLTTMDAVKEWARLFGPTEIDTDLFQFLKEELRVVDFSEHGISESTEDLRSFLVAMIDHTQWYGFPMERFQGLTTGEKNQREQYRSRAASPDEAIPHPQFPDELTHLERVNRARSSEAALFAVHSGVITRLISQAPDELVRSAPTWSDQFAVARMINRHTNGGQIAPLFTSFLNALDFREQYLYREQFHTANLSNADLSYALASNAHLNHADLSNAHLTGVNLTDADLSYAHLSYAHLSGANLSGANLSNANLSDAHLSNANLSNANLSDAHLSGADLSNANLSNADLSGADLSGADLTDADLSYADLS